MNYTKGEWRLKSQTKPTLPFRIEANMKGLVYDVADIYIAISGDTKANAQLISSSPEMYEALRHTEIMLSNLDRQRGLNQQQILLHKEVSMALAKAEGK